MDDLVLKLQFTLHYTFLSRTNIKYRCLRVDIFDVILNNACLHHYPHAYKFFIIGWNQPELKVCGVCLCDWINKPNEASAAATAPSRMPTVLSSLEPTSERMSWRPIPTFLLIKLLTEWAVNKHPEPCSCVHVRQVSLPSGPLSSAFWEARVIEYPVVELHRVYSMLIN